MMEPADNIHIYSPKWFEPYELLPPEVFQFSMIESEEAKERTLNTFFDYKLLVTIDVIRDIIGAPLICNNWIKEGARKYSGYRPNGCHVGVKKSQHKPQEDGKARAADLICYQYTAEEMRKKIDENQDKLPFPIRIEKDVTWLHVDTMERERNQHEGKIYYFKG